MVAAYRGIVKNRIRSSATASVREPDAAGRAAVKSPAARQADNRIPSASVESGTLDFKKELVLNNNSVAVIGGGLGGLYAARLLSRANVDFVLLEAQARLGGRILSGQAGNDRISAGGIYDLGPTWYWPALQTRMPALVHELGLQSFEQPAAGAFLWEDSAGARRRIESGAADNGSMRLDGGIAQLAAALEADIDPHRVLRGCRVVGVRLKETGIDLEVAAADGSVTRHAAGCAISTLPLRMLASAIAFEPGLPPAVIENWSSIPTWMAAHAKFVAVYERAFWRDAGLSGQAQSQVGPLAEIHDASPRQGLPALFGFVGIPARARRTQQAHVEAAALAQLRRLFGPQAAAPLFTFYKDWAADPFVATAADAVAPGFHPSYGAHAGLPAQWAKRLVLAGTESAPGHGGYLEGALEASETAVAAILSNRPVRQAEG